MCLRRLRLGMGRMSVELILLDSKTHFGGLFCGRKLNLRLPLSVTAVTVGCYPAQATQRSLSA
jgi:hypothetical protein